MAKEKWKVALKILPETEERVWVVHNRQETHKDYLGRVMEFNARKSAEKVANHLNRMGKRKVSK